VVAARSRRKAVAPLRGAPASRQTAVGPLRRWTPAPPANDGGSACVAAAQHRGGKPSNLPRLPPAPAPQRVGALAAGARGNVSSSHPPAARRGAPRLPRGWECRPPFAAAGASAGRRRRPLPLARRVTRTAPPCGAAILPGGSRRVTENKKEKPKEQPTEDPPGSQSRWLRARRGGEGRAAPHRPCTCRRPLIIWPSAEAVGISWRATGSATGGCL